GRLSSSLFLLWKFCDGPLETVEGHTHGCLALSDPLVDDLESSWADLVCPDSADLMRYDDASIFEQPEVLQRRGKPHPGRFGELPHRGRTGAQTLHHSPATGIRESREYAIKRCCFQCSLPSPSEAQGSGPVSRPYRETLKSMAVPQPTSAALM